MGRRSSHREAPSALARGAAVLPHPDAAPTSHSHRLSTTTTSASALSPAPSAAAVARTKCPPPPPLSSIDVIVAVGSYHSAVSGYHVTVAPHRNEGIKGNACDMAPVENKKMTQHQEEEGTLACSITPLFSSPRHVGCVNAVAFAGGGVRRGDLLDVHHSRKRFVVSAGSDERLAICAVKADSAGGSRHHLLNATRPMVHGNEEVVDNADDDGDEAEAAMGPAATGGIQRAKLPSRRRTFRVCELGHVGCAAEVTCMSRAEPYSSACATATTPGSPAAAKVNEHHVVLGHADGTMTMVATRTWEPVVSSSLNQGELNAAGMADEQTHHGGRGAWHGKKRARRGQFKDAEGVPSARASQGPSGSTSTARSQTAATTTTIRIHTKRVASVDVHPASGGLLGLSCGDDRFVALLDLSRATVLAKFKCPIGQLPHTVRFSPGDGQYFVVVVPAGVYVFETATVSLVATWEVPCTNEKILQRILAAQKDEKIARGGRSQKKTTRKDGDDEEDPGEEDEEGAEEEENSSAAKSRTVQSSSVLPEFRHMSKTRVADEITSFSWLGPLLGASPSQRQAGPAWNFVVGLESGDIWAARGRGGDGDATVSSTTAAFHFLSKVTTATSGGGRSDSVVCGTGGRMKSLCVVASLPSREEEERLPSRKASATGRGTLSSRQRNGWIVLTLAATGLLSVWHIREKPMTTPGGRPEEETSLELMSLGVVSCGARTTCLAALVV